MAKKLNQYNVTARLVLYVDVDIKAESFADALEKAKGMRETDFVNIPNGHFLDGSIAISGVNTGAWSTEQDGQK
jgi:hypothetical protein